MTKTTIQFCIFMFNNLFNRFKLTTVSYQAKSNMVGQVMYEIRQPYNKDEQTIFENMILTLKLKANKKKKRIKN